MANVSGTNKGETINGLDGVTNGNDLILGLGGNDTIFGLGGNDEIRGGDGADHIDGGNGFDTASYVDSNEGVLVLLKEGLGFGGTAEGDHLFNIEAVTGSTHDDRLVGGDSDDVLNGLDGADILKGGGGADKLFGGNGTDTLQGGAGRDTLDGGSGADTMSGGNDDDIYIVDNAGDVVIEGFHEGVSDHVRTSVTYTLTAGSEIEVLETVDRFATTALDLVGNESANIIVGNDGNNVIVGGLGRDTLLGFGGADVFVWTSIAETGVSGTEFVDVVGGDFDPLVGDLLAFNPIDADETVAGDQAFTFIGSGPFTAPGQISTVTDGIDTFILLNTDGDAVQEATIRVLGVHAVDATWFVL